MNGIKNDALIVAGIAIVGIWLLSKAGQAVSDTANNLVQGAADAANAVNPLNPNNVFSNAANSTTQALTSDPNTSLGVWFYNFTHGG